METPLIVKHTKPNASSTNLKLTCLLFIFALFCFLISSPLLHYVNPGENLIGAGEEINAIMIKIYFSAGHLVDHMGPGHHYKSHLAAAVKLEPFEEHCGDSTPLCTDVCQIRIHASNPGTSEPPACQHREESEAVGSMECWDTTKMECWSEGSIWNDGGQNWIVQNHDKTSMDVSWLHMKKQTFPFVHIFLFGVGEFQPHNVVCAKLASAADLLRAINDVRQSEPIVFGGHSSGSAWAMCANFYLNRLRPQHSRRLIASGAMLATSSFLQSYSEVKPWETDLYLLNAAILNGPTAVLLPDLEGIQNSPDGITMPQFGFACTINPGSPMQCASPQPIINIAQAFSFWFNPQADPMVEQFRAGMSAMMPHMHAIDMYQDCFNACWDYFRTQNWNFSPNVFHYSKIDPTNQMTAALANLGIRWSDYMNILGSGQGVQIPAVSDFSSSAGPSAPAVSSSGAGPSTDTQNSDAAVQSLQIPTLSDQDNIDQEQGEITPTHDF